MPSLGRAIFGLGPCQSFDCEIIKEGRPHPQVSGAWGIPSPNTLGVCKGLLPHRLTLMCPSVHTEHAGSVWAPVGLTAYHGQIGLKNLAFPVVVSEWAQPLPSSGPLVDLSGCLQPLWPSLLLKTK